MSKKDFKIIFYIGLFNLFKCFCYFITKVFPLKYHLIGNTLDQKIPLESFFIWFYILWYVLIIFIPYFLYKRNKKLFYKYLILDLICLTIDLIIYVLYPSMIERPVVSGSGINNTIINTIYFLDTPAVNCLPSEHCILCFIFMFITIINKNLSIVKKVILNMIYILIILSTLFIHQHVIYDVIAAFIVVLVAIIINMKYNLEDKLKNKMETKKVLL